MHFLISLPRCIRQSNTTHKKNMLHFFLQATLQVWPKWTLRFRLFISRMLRHVLGSWCCRACVQGSWAAQWSSADVDLAFSSALFAEEESKLASDQQSTERPKLISDPSLVGREQNRSADVGLEAMSVYKSIIGTGKPETSPRSVLPLSCSLGVTLGMFGSASLLLWALRLSADSGLSGTELLLPSVFLGIM